MNWGRNRVARQALCNKIARQAVWIWVLCAFSVAAQANPALWKVTSQGATIYLFGTVHVLPKSVKWVDPKIEAALAASSELWTEADVSNLSETVDAMRHYGIAKPGETESLLPPPYRTRYARQISEVAFSPVVFAHARPWLAEMLLSTAALQRAGNDQPGVDFTLLQYAHDHKLVTPTFETVDQQSAMLSDMPEEAQIASLEDTIDEFDQAGPIFSKLLGAWQSGDEAQLDELINKAMRARSEIVWTEVILRRNEKFAEKISDRLQGSGTAFVAVGAGHLCGQDGIPALLEKRGFTVTRIE
jgi:uncharacterized protein YbaP (TraB family)